MIGADCEAFINYLISQKIPLERIGNTENVLYADTDVRNYPFIAKVSREFGVRVRVAKRKGLYFRLRPLKKRPGLIIGGIAASFMVLVLRSFVWDIDVHGNNELSRDHILKLLEQYGFTAGVLANDTDALDAERRIMMQSDRIKWINIEVNGSRADVYLSESSDEAPDDIDFMTPCNIVASHSGVIVDTDVTSGKLMYEKGSGVAEGNVIVSGTVSSGDAQIIVHSDAKIIAEFKEKPTFSMNYVTTEKVPSDESFTHRQLMILGMVIPLDQNNNDISDTICTESTEQVKLWDISLPLRIRTENYRRYKEVSVTRTADDVRANLERQLELYQKNFMHRYEILDIKKKYSETEDGLILEAEIKLKGDIARKQPIYEHG